MLPLQVPGGPELAILGLILLIFVGIAVVIWRVLQFLASDTAGDVSSLEARVAELERRVEALEAGG